MYVLHFNSILFSLSSSSFFLGSAEQEASEKRQAFKIGVVEEIAGLSAKVSVQFSGGAGCFPASGVLAKTQNTGHDGAQASEGGGYESSIHADASKSDRIIRDYGNNGALTNCGAADGARLCTGTVAVNKLKTLAYYAKALERDASATAFNNARIPIVEHANPSEEESTTGMYIWRGTWAWAMNGIIRHRERQINETTRVYHQGAGTGPCFNILMTFTRDLTGPETKWVLIEMMKCLDRIKRLFVEF